MVDIIAYYRVSTKQQGESGLGLEAQETAVRAYGREKGAIIKASYVEVESGKLADFSTMEQQMRATYANAAKLLARFGATLDHVVEETLYVLDVDAAFAVAGKVRKEAYAVARPRCASNLIGVARLAFPEQIIEIAFKAVMPPV